jgi:ribonucleotide monophosphatase NagD (HAD superfamily)
VTDQNVGPRVSGGRRDASLLDSFDAFVFDLDGTVYLGDVLLPGARPVIDALRDRGKVVRFITNNPTKDPFEYANKLTRLGIPTSADHVVNTVSTMARWLHEYHPDAVVFPNSEPPLVRWLQRLGIPISEKSSDIDKVEGGFDDGVQ